MQGRNKRGRMHGVSRSIAGLFSSIMALDAKTVATTHKKLFQSKSSNYRYIFTKFPGAACSSFASWMRRSGQ